MPLFGAFRGIGPRVKRVLGGRGNNATASTNARGAERAERRRSVGGEPTLELKNTFVGVRRSQKRTSLPELDTRALEAAVAKGPRSSVGIAIAYEEMSELQGSPTKVNWNLMHKIVPDTLFSVVVKKSVDASEISRAFGVSESVIERNWNQGQLAGHSQREEISGLERRRKMSSFSKPVDAEDLFSRLHRLRTQTGAPQQAQESDELLLEEAQENLYLESKVSLKSGETFAAEVFVDKLRHGEVCVSLKAGDCNIEVYSNGEIYCNREYRGCGVGFGSKSTLKFVLERECGIPLEYCSLVTTDSEKSSYESAFSGSRCELPVDNAILTISTENAHYFQIGLPFAANACGVAMSVTYPRTGRVGLYKLVGEIKEETDVMSPVQKLTQFDVEMLSPVVAI